MSIRGNGNVLIGTTTDSGFRLDVSGSGVSGSVRFQNDLTVTGSMNITGSLVVSGSITNVLPSGPTWFTSDIVNSSTVTFHTATPTANNYFIRSDSSSTLLNGSNNVIFRIGNSTRAQIFNNGNFLIQNGGSTDLGYRLSVNGPGTSGSLYVSGSSIFIGNQTITGSVNITGSLVVSGSISGPIDGANIVNNPAINLFNYYNFY
jgi:cytoskeletal protein CcmA (bactofilin family)